MGPLDVGGLRSLLNRLGAQRLPATDVYELRPSSADQVQLLEAIRSLDRPVYLVTYEEPTSWGLTGFQLAGEHTWRVPESVKSRLLIYGLLESGSWRAYAADGPVPLSVLPDLFRLGGASSITDFDAVLVDAWYDSVEWRLYIPA